MKNALKSALLIAFLLLFTSVVKAQSVSGKLTLNEKSMTDMKLSSSSPVQLFKEFKTGKYKLKFFFSGKGIKPTSNKEMIVFFDFITVVKFNGKTVKKVKKTTPTPYFPGDMGLPAEAFDFVGILANMNDDDEVLQTIPKGKYGSMEKGTYTVELYAQPRGVSGKISPVVFTFRVK